MPSLICIKIQTPFVLVRILNFLLGIVLCLCCCSCSQNTCTLEPIIIYTPQQRLIERLPSPFPDLPAKESLQDWEKELYIGRTFAHEMDLYRAITCFKRALILLPNEANERRIEIEYDIFLAYYAGNKFQEAIDTFENSSLIDSPMEFPALRDLLILLYDAYQHNKQPEKSYRILSLLSTIDKEASTGLILQTAVIDANFPLINQAAPDHPAGTPVKEFIYNFQYQAKSVKKAQMLNTFLPGAGYLYVGQKKTALTSFLINTLFIAATYQLFDRGYIAAGIITASLEMGWYFGGINGAGLAAKEYNERLYESCGKETLVRERLFPILMLQMGF